MKQKYYSYIYMIPTLLIFTVFFWGPVLAGLGMSLTDWATLNNTGIHFAGTYQFKSIWDMYKVGGFGGDVGMAFKNTFIMAIVVTIFQNILGLLLGLVLNMPLKTRGFLRSAFFSPCIFSSIIIAYSFSAILYPAGPFDQILKAVGLEGWIHNWLVDSNINILTISGINIWMYLGFSATIYLAGLKAIPPELDEAAKIDGAGTMQKFRNITFPLIAPSLTINILLSLVGTMKTFDLPYLLSGKLAYVINTLVYMQYSQGLYAFAAALSVVLFIVILIIAIPSLLVLKKREVEM